MIQYSFDISENEVFKILKAIDENDGYVVDVPEKIQNFIIPNLATVELSPHTGIITQWKLTGAGKKELRRIFGYYRRKAKRSEQYSRSRDYPAPRPVVALTIELLDALKSILDTGAPGTDKMDIISHIQLNSGNGPLAEYKDGVWSLTRRGKYHAVAHIRKAECAQFSGKVR